MTEISPYNENQPAPFKSNIHTTPVHPLSAKGRSGRLSYLAWLLITIVASLPAGGIIGAIIIAIAANTHSSGVSTIPGQSDADDIIFWLAIATVYIGPIYFSFVLSIRRLHDLNKSGWLSLILLIPLVNIIFYFYLVLAKGSAGPNHYGLPRVIYGWEKVLGWIYAIISPIIVIVWITTSVSNYHYYEEKSRQQHLPQQSESEPQQSHR